MAPKLNFTHVGTAIAVLDINRVNMLTDPFFSTADTRLPITEDFALTVDQNPDLRLDKLPVIDAALLNYEDHEDHLD